MKTIIVVTSISGPNQALRLLAEGARHHGHEFIVVGDTKSPDNFQLEGCTFFGIKEQATVWPDFARKCPTGHYARKNVGYLLAMVRRAQCILETDDDNLPFQDFFQPLDRTIKAPVIEHGGWVNIYKYFTDKPIWPRGLPLEKVHKAGPPFSSLPMELVDCPIQQSLTQGNPDVDAIYTLLLPLPQDFRSDRRVVITAGSWCPFNSQNTAWYPPAYQLLYLPAYCSFRMTDIWRSFVAQRICHANGWGILFNKPTGFHKRNHHDLTRDFADEVVGYVNNLRLMDELQELDIKEGPEHMGANMRLCYEMCVKMGIIGAAELDLLDAWLLDCHKAGSPAEGT